MSIMAGVPGLARRLAPPPPQKKGTRRTTKRDGKRGERENFCELREESIIAFLLKE